MTKPRFPGGAHDHENCVAQALDHAVELCRRSGARLTPLRRQILTVIWESHAPVGAYEIIEKLRDHGRTAAPITVYRVLDFLMEHGLVHRLASRNAYIGCVHDGGSPGHNGQFLICDRCGTVAELEDAGIRSAIRDGARRLGFTVTRPMVEVSGLCPECGPVPGPGRGEDADGT